MDNKCSQNLIWLKKSKILFKEIISFEKGNPEKKSQDLKFLLNGVHEIAAPGQPGALSVYGDAFTIVAGKINDVIAPAIAASSYGSGRIVVFGHTEYLSQDEKHTPTEADMVKFFNNAIHWAARSSSLNDNVTLAVYERPNFVKFLKEHSINCKGLSHIGGKNELKNYQVRSEKLGVGWYMGSKGLDFKRCVNNKWNLL